MRRRLTLYAALSLVAASAVAQPITVLEEDWDAYVQGTDDPDYNEKWLTLPGENRYEILQPAEGEVPNVNSAPGCLRIPKEQTLGITRNLRPDLETLVPGATEIIGTEGSKLIVIFVADLNRGAVATSDIFVEISKGDWHVDETSGVLKDVIAFGMTQGYFGPSAVPQVFDGINWVPVPKIITGDRFNQFTLEISEEEVTLSGSRRASGSVTLARNYLGGFDRISIRTVKIPGTGKRCTADDLLIQGGQILSGDPVETRFKRGDGDATDRLDLSDSISTLSFLFLGSDPPECNDAADVDDSGRLDISDAIYSLTYLFLGGPPPESPFPDCGVDGTDDNLGCKEYSPCNP